MPDDVQQQPFSDDPATTGARFTPEAADGAPPPLDAFRTSADGLGAAPLDAPAWTAPVAGPTEPAAGSTGPSTLTPPAGAPDGYASSPYAAPSSAGVPDGYASSPYAAAAGSAPDPAWPQPSGQAYPSAYQPTAPGGYPPAPQGGYEPAAPSGYPSVPQGGYPSAYQPTAPGGYPSVPQGGYEPAAPSGYPSVPQDGYPSAPQGGAVPGFGAPPSAAGSYPPVAPPGYPPQGVAAPGAPVPGAYAAPGVPVAQAPAGPERVGAGLLFAVGGILLGVVLSTIIWRMGFFASITSFVMAAAAIWLYGVGAKTAPRKGAVPLIVMILLGAVLALVVGVGSDIYFYAIDEGFFASDAMALTIDNIANPEIWSGYVPAVAMYLLFAGLGTFRVITSLAKR
ncbi:hypothetical protein [Propionicicella superfundia]|uniref:hypothetical protein n=1 Tax=Propionicicella superfundia TaxID=348582 RepID=UPI000425281C|nr:hypothetical protein [Propionicicella superfundia]